MRFFLAITIAAILGCTANQPAAGQTTYDAQQDARIKALEDKVFGTTTGGGTTGGTTTGGSTTGGTTTGGTTTGGSTTSPPAPAYRTIFAMTDSPNQLMGFERCENAEFPTQPATVQVVNSVAGAYAGNYYLSTSRGSGQNNGVRIHNLFEYGPSCQKIGLPKETLTTFMVRIPQAYTFSWLQIFGWKQNNKPSSYNEPTINLEFASRVEYLRCSIKGASPTAVGSGPVVWSAVYGNNLNNPGERHNVKFPINQWVKIDFYVKHSTGADGQLRVYQDGNLIIAYNGRTMRENAPNLEAQLTCYGSGNGTTVHFDNYTLMSPQ